MVRARLWIQKMNQLLSIKTSGQGKSLHSITEWMRSKKGMQKGILRTMRSTWHAMTVGWEKEVRPYPDSGQLVDLQSVEKRPISTSLTTNSRAG